jgi:hypothetical protein
MIKRLFVYTLIILLIDPMFSCGRSRRRSARTRAPRERVLAPTIPDEKRDTVYMIVPDQPDVPNVTPNNSDGDVIIPSNKKLKPVQHDDNLPVPPQIDFTRPTGSRTRNEYIEYYNITGEMKELIVACDYDNPTVRNNSVALVALSSGNFNLGQICDIFDFCYSNWSYVNDPVTRDYYAKASETLRNGLNGDCDDFAILLCSMILSIGGEARINFAYDAASGHAFAEVNIGKTDRRIVERYLTARYGHSEMWHKEDRNGNWWLNLDWQGQYPGAKYWKYSNGTCFNIIRNEMYKL